MEMNMLLYIICALLYLYSGPLIRWILISMSDMKMPKTDNVGLMIGYLERFLIIIFVMQKEYTAIGLVIASKSILRFNDLKNDPPDMQPDKIDKRSEYILLGTMLSLTFGMLIGQLATIDFNKM